MRKHCMVWAPLTLFQTGHMESCLLFDLFIFRTWMKSKAYGHHWKLPSLPLDPLRKVQEGKENLIDFGREKYARQRKNNKKNPSIWFHSV